MTGQAIHLVAIGLFLGGTAAFLYKGLNSQSGHVIPHSPKPAAVAAPPGAATRAQQPGAPKLPPELIGALVKHGDQALALGDIAAARLWYQRAAEAGSGPAATALGKTYDPNYSAPGSDPNFTRAVEWYQRAIALGDAQAADILRKSSPH